MKGKFIIYILIVSTLLACGGNKKHHRSRNKKKIERTVGIAFGGGGAKAAAEVGVLKVIEEAGINVGYVSGSSMGAVIGGLYAAGYTANEIDSLLMTEEWLSLFDRNEMLSSLGSYDRTFLGVIKGDYLEKMLGIALAEKGCTLIEDTKKKNNIKFSCTTTQVINKESIDEYDIVSGNMAKAIRASMSYPVPIAGFEQVEWEGRSLVDGGMVNNLPVDLVKKIGAKKVIAIDLESADKGGGELPLNVSQIRSLIGISTPIEEILGIKWLADWLSDHRKSNEKRVENFESADVKIRIDLEGFSIFDFNLLDMHKMSEIGEDVAKTYHWDSLKKLK